MKRKSIFLLLLICSFALFFFFPTRTENNITKTLSTISPSDQEQLKHFFHYLLFHEHFAYTLFCDKPLALSICPELDQHTTDETLPYITSKDWETWEKYQHLFPMKNYALRKLTAEKKTDTVILLINKKEFLKTVAKHKKLFRAALSSEVTPKQLLHTFLTHPRPFKKGLNNRSLLKGLLFGFGKNNASLYQRRRNIEHALLNNPSRAYLHPRPPFHTLEEEFQHLTQQLRPFSPKSPTHLRLPTFYADPTTQETLTLKAKYKRQRTYLLSHLTQDNFLTLTLTQLTSR